MATKYVSTLTGAQMDQAMKDMNNHVSEAWATGTRGGTAVVSGDETYHNNAKYYSQNSATSASNASSSASSASASATSASNSASSASASETNASNSANSARTYANNASASADRAEAIVGGQFISYGTNQVEGLTEAQHKTATYNVFGKPSTSTLDFLTRVSENNYLAKIKKLSGKSVGVNQLCYNGNFASTTGWNCYDHTMSASGNVLTLTRGSSASANFCVTTTNNIQYVSGHKYYWSVSGKANRSIVWYINFDNIQVKTTTITTDWATQSGILTSNGYVASNSVLPFYAPLSQTQSGDIVYLRNVNVIDLTLIFGSGSEPSTVDSLKSAWLTKFGYPLPTYIPYNSGSIVDCDIKGIGATGRNLVDIKNKIAIRYSTSILGFRGSLVDIGNDVYEYTPYHKFDTLLFGPYRVTTGDTYTLTYEGEVLIYSYGAMCSDDTTFVQGLAPTSTTREGDKNTLKYTIPIDGYAYFGLLPNKTSTVTIGKPQLEHGSTATSYEPYSPYYRSFPIILRSAGNVKDTVEDCGNGYKVTRRVGQVTFDGSETWAATSSYVYCQKTMPSGGVWNASKFTSSYFHPYNSVSGFIWFDANRTKMQFNGITELGLASNTDANAWKTYLTTHPLTLNYELATPVTEYHSYNLTYPVTLNGTEYFDSPMSVPCEIEYGVDALEDIASGVVNSPTDLDRASVYASNPNLLDNGWFTVNQRGASSYTSSGYTVDRWKIATGTLEVVSGGVKRTTTTGDTNLYQNMEFDPSLVGKTLVASIIIDEQLFTTQPFVYKANAVSAWLELGYVNTPYGKVALLIHSSSSAQFCIKLNTNTTATIKAVKLELGSVSTLANDNAPDYATELLKCQRYFYRWKAQSGYSPVGFGMVDSTTEIRCILNFPTTMRTITSVGWSGSHFRCDRPTQTLVPTAIALKYASCDSAIIALTVSGATINTWFMVQANSNSNAYIDVNADL